MLNKVKMKLDRKEILKALETITVAGEGKNMVESGAVQNVVTFGDEVVVDLLLTTPALHIKKRAEVDIMKVIHEKVYEKAKIKVNIKVEAPEKPENPNLIKGKANSWNQKYYCSCFWKRRCWKIYSNSKFSSYFSKNGF